MEHLMMCDSKSVVSFVAAAGLQALGCALLALSISTAAAAGGKRVLIIHSVGSASPPFTTHSTAFETELTAASGERFDLDEVSLDHARYAAPEMQDALVQYLQKRQASWQPDLVVPIGSPAAVFVAQYRERLFPKTPVLYTGLDQRRLSPEALRNNAAFVGESFDVPGFIQDILQVAPATTNIVVVIGASEVEQYWAAAFQKEFEPFTNRVAFTWLNHLSFDQMLERLGRLPPRSFIFLILLLRDAAGVTHNADEALKRIHAVANAPVNSIFEHQLGLGIVGGRLYRAERVGVVSAHIAIRILHGEPATNFPPRIIAPIGTQYDWRELRRWKMSEDHLPSGSILRFRLPTPWQRHRAWIIAGVSLFITQALLILGLLANLAKRRRAEQLLLENKERMKLAASAARLRLWEWDMVSDEIKVTSHNPAGDLNGAFEQSNLETMLRQVHPDDRIPTQHALANSMNGDGEYDSVHRLKSRDGHWRWIAAHGQIEFGQQHQPLRMRGISMDITARKEAEERARESEGRFIMMANSAPVLMWASGTDKLCTFLNQTWLDFTGRSPVEELGDGWEKGVHPDDLADCMKTYTESFDARRPFTMEFRVRRYDGEYRWISSHGVPRYDAQNSFVGYIGSCIDVTDHKRAREEAERSRDEMAHLTRISTLALIGGSLAHELNQPLTAILCNAQAASRFLDAGPSHLPEIRAILKDIAAEDRRAGEIIVRMREMLKKERAKMQPQDLNQMIRDVLGIMRSELLFRKVTPITRLPSKLPLVEGDRVRLQQVLINLILNGCDAMAAIPAKRRQLIFETGDPEAGFVQASVADCGPGFSSENSDEVFKPFRTTKPSGLGLGLSICRSIIETHGGKFWAGNSSEGGAVVRFTLPVSHGGRR